MHAVWTDCRGGSSLASGAARVVPYNGPSPPTGSHRYIFVLFEQTSGAGGAGGAGAGAGRMENEEEVEQVRVRSTCRKRWDFRQFLIDNPHLKPKAVNYFYCSRERV